MEVVPQQLVRIVSAEIPRHHLDPDEDVRAGPRLRLDAEEREFRRQAASVVRRDEGVHAGAVRVDLLLRPRRRAVPRLAGGAAEADSPQKTILLNRRQAEDLRQASVADATLKLHLPQTILRVRVSQSDRKSTRLNSS